MNKKKTSLIAITSLLFLAACQKDSDKTPVLSAIGFWKGVGFAGSPIAILNKVDGTTRLYTDLPGTLDTATAGKLDGTFTFMGNVFRSHVVDTLGTVVDIQSSRIGENYMDGIFFVTGGQGPFRGITFEVIKQ
jgi:hypothetical protein